MALTATVTYDKLIDSYDVEFHFNRYGGDYETLQALIKIFKTSIAVSNREYNPETKHWSFSHIAFKNVVEKLFETMRIKFVISEAAENTRTVGPDNFFYEHAVNQHIPESPVVLGAKLMQLLGITEEILKDSNALKKVYRVKAREFHPDLGGDAAKMSELNRLWTLFNDMGVS